MKNIYDYDLNLLKGRNLISEDADLAISFNGYLIKFLLHCFKYEFQPNKQSASWIESIINSHKKMKDILDHRNITKSKINKIKDNFLLSYNKAIKQFYSETGFDKRKFDKKIIDEQEYTYDKCINFNIKDFLNKYKFSDEAKKFVEKYNEENAY